MEIWKDVPDAPGYIVSDQGRAAKLMSLNTNAALGYVQYAIPDPARPGKRLRFYLHHWVLTAFVGAKPFKGALARHKNDVPTDNRLENLEWGTRSQNQHDSFRNGKRIHKTHCVNGHALEGENLAPGNRCRTCQRTRARAQHARRKEVAQ